MSYIDGMTIDGTDYKIKDADADAIKTAINVLSAGKSDFSGTWEIGNISGTTGNNSNDNKTIRTVGSIPYSGEYLQFDGVLRGDGETYDRIAYVYYYSASGYTNRILLTDGVAVTLPAGTTAYRLTYGFVAASGITISSADTYIADYGLKLITKTYHDKQDVLTFDVTPTEGSTNPVTSGGVFAAAAEERKQSSGNLLSGFIAPSGETYKNVKYEWNNGVCHVTNPESGGATATSYTDVFADPNAFPVGMEARGTYKVSGASENVQFRFYQAVSGSFVSSPTILATNEDAYLTIPSDASGLRLRLYVFSGTTLNEYITPCIQRIDQPERLVFPHRIAMFGDSITAGRDGDAEAGVHTLYEIPATVAKRLGCVVDNLGVGSMGWLAEGSGMNAYGKISTTDLTPYDVITLCFGVNDGFRPIGNYNSTDETEVMGQFNKVINYIYTQKPAVQVIVIAPFNGCNVGSFPKYWYGTVPSTAYSRGVLSDTLKEACEYYNIPYIEQKNGPLNGFTVKKNILDSNGKSLTYMGADGVHPSNAGYKALGGWISGEIARLIG